MKAESMKVRKASAEVGELANRIRQLRVMYVQSARKDTENGLSGETAEAINQMLEKLSLDMRDIGEDLSVIQMYLKEYARLLDEADEKVAAEIRKN